MANQHVISRRHMMAMSAASAVAAASGIRVAPAQIAKRIEQLAPELDKIISMSEPILELAGGVGGDDGPPRGLCGGRKAAICCSATFITIGA